MRKILIWGMIVIFLLIGIAIIIPFLVPASVYKSAIQTELSDRLGRQVAINGDVSISPFPVLKARSGEVTIANPDGFSESHFASMEGMDVRIRLLPLLSKNVEVASFDLKSPKINLEKLKNGDVNWTLGNAEAQTESSPAGPFKRDGRLASLDPKIGKFSLIEGTIIYRDAVKGTNYNIENVNLTFELPSLAKNVTLDGDLIFNGLPMDVDISLDSPRSFLDGKKTPVKIMTKTDFGSFAANGHFLEGEDIKFALDVDSSINDINPLKDYLPKNLPIIGIVKSLDLSGNYSFDGNKILAKGADIAIDGPLLKSRFSGDADLGKTPVLNGALDMNVSDVPEIARIMNLDIEALKTLQTIDLKADLEAKGGGFISNKLTANITGDGLEAQFNGSGSFDGTPQAKGSFTSKINSVPALLKSLAIEAPQASALGSANANGTISLNGTDVSVDIENADTKGDNLNASYQGSFNKTGEDIGLDGTFSSSIGSVPALLQTLAIEAPQASALGSANANGTIKMTGDVMNINIENAKTDGDNLNASYQGTITTTGDNISLSGAFTGDVPSMSRFAQATQTEFAYATSIERVAAKGNISGTPGDLKFSDLDVQLRDGQVNGQFTGDATFKDSFDLNGYLDAEIPSARALAATTGTQLPPSTAAGQIYERVALKGNITGSPAAIKFAEADLALDAINGDGNFTLDLTQTKPEMKGTLDLGQLDLRPYMAAYMAQNAGKGIQPWAETPYNFAALRAMDGNYTIKTPEILFGNLKMGQTDVDAKVRNGILTAQLPQINLYGGLGILTATVDASGDIPKVKMDVRLEDITTNRFLSSIANFSKLEGKGHTLLEITGEGRTQAEIMKSLDGYGDFEVLNGVVSGIDLSQFLQGVDDTLVSRAIPKGLGKDYSTKFDDIVGKFKIQDGVVSLDAFNLKAFNALASGTGKLDIGNQSLDFGLRPRLVGSNAGDIGKFGIPLRLKGDWGDVKVGLDTDLLTTIAAEKAKLRAKQEITDRVGGGLGNVLGSVLGVPKEPAAETGAGTPAETPPAQNTEPDPVKIITGLLGSKEPEKAPEAVPVTEEATAPETQAEDAPTPESEPEEKPEEKDLGEQLLDEALGGLFGKKKKGGE